MKLLVATALLADGLSTAQTDHSKRTKQQHQLIDGNPATSANTEQLELLSSTKKIKPYDDTRINAPKERPVDYVDIGILFDEDRDSSLKNRHLATELCPISEYVVCVKGMAILPTGIVRSCYEECDGKCCDGTKACHLFTGVVCRDSVSCYGEKSCYNATIFSLYKGCTGDKSCAYANITSVYAGCDGIESCYSAGYLGHLSEVREGCIGREACTYAAEYGQISRIENSCIGIEACAYAAAGAAYYTQGGTIANIYGSCIGERACESAAYDYGSNIGNIVASCKGFNLTCYYAAAYGGHIGNIVYSCYREEACNRIAACQNAYPECGSKVTELFDACVGIQSCTVAAYSGGYINGIRSACNNARACFSTGAFIGDIPSGIEDCCSAEQSECENMMKGADLPMECGLASSTKSPTSGTSMPSRPPTMSPTKHPTKQPTQRPTAKPTVRPTRQKRKPNPKPSRTKSKKSKQSKQSKPGGKQSKLAKVKDKTNEVSYSYTVKRAREHAPVAASDIPLHL
eukprot:CAMPEP_0183713434 /NCGR_PEP_ID=MMETSP0737-20130205/8274_1 /TAXON_ID=385413 /ORGANISM="Thalassiosira miniscula, Strain CCMP1093" /LENGTH=515 /DNA_ID=CAMNT_0025942211 /DNA_START=168 /DNA_END=1715 /DNA_ORIENTATION=+